MLAVGLISAAFFVVACGGSTPTTRPSASLITLDFTPLPTLAPPPSVAASRTPRASTVAPTWPAGWDVAFCNAFADTTVAHELIIDIERALADNNRSDAQGLAAELAQTTPIASNEINRLSDWEPSAELKADLAQMLDLDSQAADAYTSYFKDGVKSGLRDARQLRTQVSRQVAPANEQLASLAALGLTCPGTDLKLETF